MVTTMDLSLKIVVCLVQAAPKLTPSPCLVPAFACVSSGSGDEANANRTRDLCTGVLMTDGGCSLPRLGTDALLSRRMTPFDDDILSISLSPWSARHHRGSHTSQDVMGVVAALLPASLFDRRLCDVLPVLNKRRNPHG